MSSNFAIVTCVSLRALGIVFWRSFLHGERALGCCESRLCTYTLRRCNLPTMPERLCSIPVWFLNRGQINIKSNLAFVCYEVSHFKVAPPWLYKFRINVGYSFVLHVLSSGFSILSFLERVLGSSVAAAPFKKRVLHLLPDFLPKFSFVSCLSLVSYTDHSLWWFSNWGRFDGTSKLRIPCE